MQRERLLTAVLLVITAAALSGQTRPKRFLTAPLTIKDQGLLLRGRRAEAHRLPQRRTARARYGAGDESVFNGGEGKIVGGDVSAGAGMIPGIARISDDGAWTNWFGHLVPANSTIRRGRLVPHADPADLPAAVSGRQSGGPGVRFP